MLKSRMAGLLVLFCLPLAGCLSFQQSRVNYGLKRHQYIEIGPKKQRVRIFERGNPKNPHVILLHGYGSSGVVWLGLMKTLERLGYHALAFDLPGFGLSDKYDGNYDTRHIADQVSLMMAKKGINKADVIAHSWGSSVALALTLRHRKKVRRLVIHGGWVYSAQMLPVLRWAKIPIFGELLYGVFFKERPEERFASSFYNPDRMVKQAIVEKIKEALDRPGYLAAALAVARGMNYEDMEKKYRSITQPALLLWGKQDHVSLPFYGRRLSSELPHSRFYTLDRCGHMPMLERPYLVRRYVSSFLGPATRLRQYSR